MEKPGKSGLMDYAQILGIRRDAGAKEIKQAYARLIKQFRPDSHPIEFGKIREAYEFALKQLAWHAENIQRESIELEKPVLDSPAISSGTLVNVENINLPEQNEKNANITESNFTIFLKNLNELALNSSEIASKELTLAYVHSLNKTSLDEKFHIEIELLTWIFNTDKPLLLAFLQIDNYFRWTKTGAYAIRSFSEWELEKLVFLRQLAETYNKAIEEKDSNLVSEKSDSWKLIQSVSNISKRNEWQSVTQRLGYGQLTNYFKTSQQSKFQITWSDLLVASMMSAIGVLFARYFDFAHTNLIAAAIFAMSILIKVYFSNYLLVGYEYIKKSLSFIDNRHVKVKGFLQTYKFKYGYAIIIIFILLAVSLIASETSTIKAFHWLSVMMYGVVGLLVAISAIAILAYLFSAILVIVLALLLSIANVPYTIANFIEIKLFQLFKSFRTAFQKPWTLLSTEADVQKRRHWQKVCEDFGYDSLKSYFKPPPRSKFAVTWVDILSALALSAMYWIFTNEIENITIYINASIIFLLSIVFNIFLAPFVLRRFKYNKLIKNYKAIVISFGLFFSLGFLSNHIPTNLDSKISTCNGLQSTDAPTYPRASQIHQEEGNILLELQIDFDGSVISTKIEKSSGFENLDKAALDKAKTWCFVPKTENGIPRQIKVLAPISFKLD